VQTAINAMAKLDAAVYEVRKDASLTAAQRASKVVHLRALTEVALQETMDRLKVQEQRTACPQITETGADTAGRPHSSGSLLAGSNHFAGGCVGQCTFFECQAAIDNDVLDPIRLCSAINHAVVVFALPLFSDHALALTVVMEYS
jgi:hypothetical protein